MATSEVADFFAGRSVLLTGATGFLGKCFLEKLLRSCPKVEKIFVLVRGRGTQSPQERVAAVLANELFSRVKTEQPNFAEKVVPVAGELTEPNLALTQDTVDMLAEHVSVVIHSAATVKFTEKIKLAVELNVISVRRMIQLASKFKHLVSYVHVSTAYAHTNRAFIEERTYQPSFDPQKLIDVTSALDVDLAETLTPQLIGERPNTYTFTKSIAEHLMATEGKDLPAIIVRPSIVGSTWKEPFPGWVDNFNGPVGCAFAGGTGIMRIMYGGKDVIPDLVPVDVAVNHILAAAWYSATKLYPNVTEIPVFNVTASEKNSISWGRWSDLVVDSLRRYPMEKHTFRSVRFQFVHPSQKLEYKIRSWFKHYIPAYAVDWAMQLFGSKPKMLRLYNKLDRTSQELMFFTSTSWTWETHGKDTIHQALTQHDREVFNFDVGPLNWKTYLEHMVLGIKKYLLKESTDDLKAAKFARDRLIVMSLALRALSYVIYFKLVIPFLRARGLSKSLWLTAIPLYYLNKKF
eukprot:m.370617 g.370617  ORF g.370617 m.370617 type:complete len:518 (-) comp56134_c1_seq2:44-1597(-)